MALKSTCIVVISISVTKNQVMDIIIQTFRSTDLIAQASHQLATKFHLRKNVDSKNMKNAFASSNTLGLMIHTEEKHTKGSPKIEDTELKSEKNYYAIKKG